MQHVCIHIMGRYDKCIRTCIHTHIHTHVHVVSQDINMCIYVYTDGEICTYIYIYICFHVCVYALFHVDVHEWCKAMYMIAICADMKSNLCRFTC